MCNRVKGDKICFVSSECTQASPQSPPYKYTCTSSWLMTKFCRSTKKFCRSCSLVGLGPIPPAATSVTVLQDELVNIWVLWALLLCYFIVNFFEVWLLAVAPKSFSAQKCARRVCNLWHLAKVLCLPLFCTTVPLWWD